MLNINKSCSYRILSSKWTVIYFSPPPALFVAVQDNSLYLAVRKATGCAVLWFGLRSCSHPLWLQHVEISSFIYRLWAHPKGINLSPCFIPILSRISLVYIIYSSWAECQCAGPACLCFFVSVLMKVCAAAIYVTRGENVWLAESSESNTLWVYLWGSGVETQQQNGIFWWLVVYL